MEELIARLEQIDATLDKLLAADELTDEQRAEAEALAAERSKVVGKIKLEEARLQREEERVRIAEDARRAQAQAEAARNRRAAEVVPRPGDNRVTSAGVAQPDAPAAPAVVVPATVRRAGVLRNFRGTRAGLDPEQRAYRFGQWVLAALSRQLPGRYHFPQAEEYVRQNMTAHLSNNAAGAHNLIPEEFGQDLIDLRERYGVVRRLFKNRPMESDTRTDPRRQGGLTAYFVAEGSAGTESNKTWDNVRLTAKDVMVLARMSNQVSADAVLNLADDLVGEIAYAFTNKEDDCGFNGDGTSTYGHIQGVRTKLQDVDGAGTDSAGLVTGTGNAYSELTLTDFGSVVGKLPQFADGPETVWVCHKTFYHTVMQKLELAAGGVTANEISSGDRRPRPLFFGYPVEFSQVMPSSEANSQVCSLLGNFMLGASFGDRQRDEIAFSEHATVGGENVFERNQIAVRGTERFDVNVHGVGSSAAAGPIVGLQTASS